VAYYCSAAYTPETTTPATARHGSTPCAKVKEKAWEALIRSVQGWSKDLDFSRRRWLPRQIDVDKVSGEVIKDIVLTANLTPRKCLGFKTLPGDSQKA
jgi:hypothetical protein